MYVYTGTNHNQLIVTKMEDSNNNHDGSQQEQQQKQKKHVHIQTIDFVIDEDTLSRLDHSASSTTTLPPVTFVLKHCNYPLLYVFSSFGSIHPSMVTTFRIYTNEHNNDTTTTTTTTNSFHLQRMGPSIGTGGYYVSHAMLSPIQKDVLCIVHANDGTMSFFDASNLQAISSPPLQMIATPEVWPDTRTMQPPHCLPSLRHAHYHVMIPPSNDKKKDGTHGTNANQKMVLLVADGSAQGRIWTFAVDSQGIPIVLPGNTKAIKNNNNDNSQSLTNTMNATANTTTIQNTTEPIVLHQHKCHVYGPPLTSFRWHQAMVMPPLPKTKNTPRQILIHPNQQYAYILLDSHAVIHVYEVFTSKMNTTSNKSSKNNHKSKQYFRLGGDCLQEIPLPLTHKGVGCIHAGATEMKLVASTTTTTTMTTNYSLWVANNCTRPLSILLGRNHHRNKQETILQKYTLENNGERLVPSSNNDSIVISGGWVQQFQIPSPDTILVATTATTTTTTMTTTTVNNNHHHHHHNEKTHKPSSISIGSIQTFSKQLKSTTNDDDDGEYILTNHIPLEMAIPTTATNTTITCFNILQDDVV